MTNLQSPSLFEDLLLRSERFKALKEPLKEIVRAMVSKLAGLSFKDARLANSIVSEMLRTIESDKLENVVL